MHILHIVSTANVLSADVVFQAVLILPRLVRSTRALLIPNV